MKAAILVESRKPLVVDDVELPKKLEYGQVLVKIHYSGICGSQLNEIDAVKGPDKFLPHLLGHEGGGVVEDIGPGVTVVKPGDHVVMHWRKGVGIQAPVAQYTWKGKKLNAGWITTFQEKSVVSENRLTSIPKKYDLKLATLFGCALTTGFGAINNDAKVKSGESVVVWGVGGAGMSVVLGAYAAGAYPIVAIDINDFKLKMAKKFGATHTINSTKEDTRKKIAEYVSPQGADVTIDATGIRSVRELAYDLANNRGRAIMVGVPKAGEVMSIDSFPLHFEKYFTGSHGGSSEPTYDIPRIMKLAIAGKIKIDDMITKVYPLQKINDAIAQVRGGDVIRVGIRL